MELGQRLRQARLEAGLSQRQLCGEEITRNMLSQIENGSARPSMQTLQYLANRLEKPLAWFLEEGVSANASALEQARQAYSAGQCRRAMEFLSQCKPDGEEAERYLLEVLCRLCLARQSLDQGKNAYALTLLEEAAQMGERTVYYTPGLERQRLSLCYRADPSRARELAQKLPEDLWEQLLRGHSALLEGRPEESLRLLDPEKAEQPFHHLLCGRAYMLQKDYEKAIAHLQTAQKADPRQALPLLEQCYKELGDYQQAYRYACLQRDLP